MYIGFFLGVNRAGGETAYHLLSTAEIKGVEPSLPTPTPTTYFYEVGMHQFTFPFHTFLRNCTGKWDHNSRHGLLADKIPVIYAVFRDKIKWRLLLGNTQDYQTPRRVTLGYFIFPCQEFECFYQ